MCFNSEVSINTFIFTLFAAVFALYNNVITLDLFLFILSFAIIQLVEWHAWNIINGGQKVITGLIAYLFPIITIIIQPLAAIVVFNAQYQTVVARIGEKWAAIAKKVIYIATFSLWLYGTYVYLWIGLRPKVYKSDINGHLIWKIFDLDFNLEAVFVIILYILSFLLPIALSLPYILAIIGITTYIYSLFSYLHANTWGTIWCYSANLISIVIIAQVFWSNYCNIR